MKNTKFIPNKGQTKAFERVISAIKQANKKGLVFYGKQNHLVAYTKAAENYISQFDFEDTITPSFNGGIVHYLSDNVLRDSGADDYSNYKSIFDNPDFESK